MSSPLRSRRVLLVEDQALVAMELEHLLADAGAVVVASCATAGDAQRAARDQAIDLALLDVRLRGGTSYALATELRARGVHCVFLTGYSELPDLPEALADLPTVLKPVSFPALEQVVAGLPARS